jgi:tRNA(Ile)-lysidine synthase
MTALTDFAAQVLDALEHECSVPEGATIVVGVSGGADSTALLASLAEIREVREHRVIAAHLDHALRDGSERDAAFVCDLAARLGIELREKRLQREDRASRPRENLEAAARRRRAAFLRGVADEIRDAQERSVAVALAHTADDVLETMLAALLRGAGPRGFSHPRARRADGVVRPMLQRTRREVIAYLRARGLSHVEDPTNADGSNLRSRLRRGVIPHLVRENPEVARTAARSARLFAGLDEAWTAHARSLLAPLVRRRTAEEIVLDGPAGRPYDRLVLTSILREAVAILASGPPDIGLAALERVAGAWRDGARAVEDWPGGVRVQVSPDCVCIAAAPGLPSERGERRSPRSSCERAGRATATTSRDLEIPGRFVWSPCGADRPELATEIVSAMHSAPEDPRAASGPNVGWLDADRLDLPLRIRPRAPGDRYRPLGLAGTAKVQEMLIDSKVPRISREALPIVADGRGIVWIPGFRVDERARITERTTRAIRVEARPVRLGTE